MTLQWKKRLAREAAVVFTSVVWGGFLFPPLLVVLCVAAVSERPIALSERQAHDFDVLRSLLRNPLSNRLGWALVLGSYLIFQIARLTIWAVKTHRAK